MASALSGLPVTLGRSPVPGNSECDIDGGMALLTSHETLRRILREELDRQNQELVRNFAAVFADRGNGTLHRSAGPSDAENGHSNFGSLVSTGSSSGGLAVSCDTDDNAVGLTGTQDETSSTDSSILRTGEPLGRVSRAASSHHQKIQTERMQIKMRQKDTLMVKAKEHLCHALEWWTGLEEPTREDTLISRIVKNRTFSAVCLLVILANGVVAVFAANRAQEVMFAANRAQEVEAMEPWYLYAEIAFTLFYSVELILKLAWHRLYFFCNGDMGWNIFDFVLVCNSAADLLSDDGGSIAFLRTMRVMKVSKVLRVFRMVRFLDQLRLLLNSLVGSMGSLFWSAIMLALALYLFGLVFVQALTGYLQDEGPNIKDEERDSLQGMFGSVQGTMLGLLFVALGGSDALPYYNAMAKTGQINALTFLFYIVFMQVSMINILTAVFVEGSMKLAQPDRQGVAAAVRKEYSDQRKELATLIDDLDEDHDGNVSVKEFTANILQDSSAARTYLEALGLDVYDAELFFEMLAERKGGTQVNREELIEACLELSHGGRATLQIFGLRCQTNAIYKKQLAGAKKMKNLERFVRSNLGVVVAGSQRPRCDGSVKDSRFDL